MLLFGCVLLLHEWLDSELHGSNPTNCQHSRPRSYANPDKARMSSVKKENPDSDLYGGKPSSPTCRRSADTVST